MAGRTPKKAKAAFLGNAASLLLPHMVDELSLCIAPMARSVNGATRPEVVHAAARMAEAPVIEPVSSVLSNGRARQHEAVVRNLRITAPDRVVAESKRLSERGARARSHKGGR